MNQTADRYYEDADVGDEGITPSVTVTGAMIDMYADVSGDHTPLHVDVASMRTTKNPDWGIVNIACELANQKHDVVQRGEHKLMAPCRPGASS